jgi:hypothetical protein
LRAFWDYREALRMRARQEEDVPEGCCQTNGNSSPVRRSESKLN